MSKIAQVKIFKLIFLIVSLFALYACKNVISTMKKIRPGEATQEEIICKVGSLELTREEFEQQWENFLARRKIEDKRVQTIGRREFLEELIEQMLILTYANKEGLAQKPEFRQRLKEIERELLINFALEKTVYAGLTISDDELTSYYQLHINEYVIPARVQVRHILTKTKEEAEKALQRLRSGESFDTVAREMSIHSSKIDGGVLPPFPPHTYDRAFEEAAFQLKVGGISEIVKSNLGYHIIEKIGESPAQTIPLAEAKEEIRQKILQQKKQNLYEQFLQKLRQEIPVKMYGY